MAAGLIVAIASLGGAIDASRLYMVKSQLQAGVDAAALAGGRAFSVTDGSSKSRTAQVDAYFNGNFSRTPPYMGVSQITLTPTFQTVNNINVTTVTASARVPMMFMRVFGINDKVLSATAKAELQPRPLEVMVVLDNTGSMRANLSGGKTRMTALKEAAASFVDILHQGSPQRRDLALGFIPYDVTVNVGKLLNARRPGAVAAVDGFNSGALLLDGDWPTNRYAWKGCVMNDSTIRDVSSDRNVSEAGAWDVTRTLPGEGANPAVQPYFVPPMWVPHRSAATAAQKANKEDDYYKIFVSNGRRVEPGNNLYRLDRGPLGALRANYLANTELYRGFLYDYYLGLNNGEATSGDDVIRKNNGDYLDPQNGNRHSNNWYVDWTRIPRYGESDYWSDPQTARINPQGGRADDIDDATTPMPSPNWQCPEEAMLVSYNRLRTEYDNYINNNNSAIYPANGTIHHSGLLWGYRLLVRDDVFTRTNPTSEQPRRAIVFMTDGLNEVGAAQNGYFDRTFTWYGRWSDGSISSSPNDTSGARNTPTETQMLRRFGKTCANIQRERNPPLVYIIALVANSDDVNNSFNACAPGRVYRTSSTDGLRQAFQDVAVDLVDLHLVN